jgi:ketosteroid isomerase-like protein
MWFCGQPIRASVVVATVLLTAAGMGLTGPPVYASRALHERKHDAKKQVEALEEEWRAAQLAGDVAKMDMLLSDDYIGISMTGQVNTKAQQLERIRDRKLVLSRLDLGDRQVKLLGPIAIVTSRAEVEGTNDGMPVQGTFRYTRVYQRLPTGVWKITSFEATRVPKSRASRNMQHQGNDKTADIQHIAEPK